jgi:hypothetical protein
MPTIRQGSPIMVQGRGLLGALLLAIVSGCSGSDGGKAPPWLQRYKAFQGVTGPDAVYMDVAAIELPCADAARYRDLWTFIDEGDQIIPLEKKATLAENGFRVGQVSASPPAELLALLTDKRTCPGPRRIQIVAGQEERCLDVGPPLPALSFQLWEDGRSTSVDLDKAQCCLNLAPSLTEDGRVHLSVMPKVRHSGRGKMPWKPRDDRTGWTLNLQQSIEEYPPASFEVTLSPGEYVVIGPRVDRPDSLGCQTFVRAAEAAPVQRLLVLRAWKPDGEPTIQEVMKGGPVPLASQASRPAVHGGEP